MEDLSGLNEQELERLIEQARAQQKLIEADRLARLRGSIEALARSRGLALHQVFAKPGRSLQDPFEPAQIGAVRAAIEEMIAGEGFALHEVFPERPQPPSKKEGEAKYRDPDLPKLVWDGVGKPPEWFIRRIRNGWTKQRLLVAFQDSQAQSAAVARANARAPRKRAADVNTTGLFRAVALVAGKVEEGRPDARHFPKKVERKRKARRYMP